MGVGLRFGILCLSLQGNFDKHTTIVQFLSALESQKILIFGDLMPLSPMTATMP